jgi:DNA-binding CsgD family transcriptional regulator
LLRWCEQQPQMVAFSDTCLIYRSEILQFHGAWPSAMTEALRACERSRKAQRVAPAAALYQQGEIHRLRGNFNAAEEAYHAASHQGYEPQPGLALLRAAQGRTDAAHVSIQRALNSTADRLRRNRLLAGYVEVMLAAGDLPNAERACQELEQIAAALDTDALRAMALHCRGAVAIGGGDAAAALVSLRLAFDAWQQIEAPYAAARVRALIGRACQSLGDAESAALEFSAARAVFLELGATPDLALLDAAEKNAPANRRLLTARELQVLRLIAAGKTNRRIAGELHLSERTIDRHVSNILTKLDVPSRAAATASAYIRNLL